MEDKIIKALIKEAKKAYKNGEIPVGAIILSNNKIISKAHNNRQKKRNILGHAEIISIIKAEKKLKDWRLDNCVLYVTLSPCEMCNYIINESRISKVFYLVKNNDYFNEKFIELSNYLEEKKQYETLLKKFFKKLRK